MFSEIKYTTRPKAASNLVRWIEKERKKTITEEYCAGSFGNIKAGQPTQWS